MVHQLIPEASKGVSDVPTDTRTKVSVAHQLDTGAKGKLTNLRKMVWKFSSGTVNVAFEISEKVLM